MDSRLLERASHLDLRVYGLGDEVAAVTDAALEHILRACVEVDALLLLAAHSGPEEGSEHYFGYAMEARTGRSFVHGEFIGLGVVLMSGLQDSAQARVISFLDRCRVARPPAQLGLDRATLREVLRDLPRFVREAGLPHSILDQADLDAASVDGLPDPILKERIP